jgi:hypothetical protein
MIDVVAGLIIKNKKVLIARRASHKKLAGKYVLDDTLNFLYQ